VGIIQEHYKQAYRDWKAQRKAKYRELNCAYEEALRKNNELEALCKDLQAKVVGGSSQKRYEELR
jgi:hypothetical protein